MSYTIDVARGRTTHLKNPFDFALYVALFPQLIAGPIVRFHEISDQIKDRTTSMESTAEGVVRFAHGLAKKVIIADGVAGIADAAFAADPATLGMSGAWLGVLAYTLQIYFDFSGYSDMAIGLGRIFGFKFPENFNRPYSALSVTDFWRRWHITLSNWFRDYLYIPLGGSRGAARRTYVNLWIVFLLTGAWHGANWTFVAWGIYHGGLLVAERVTGQRPVESASHEWLRRIVVLFAVMVGWVLFRAESLAMAVGYLGAMFSFGGETIPALEAALSTKAVATLILGSLVFFLPRDFVLGPIVQRSHGRIAAASRAVVMVAGLPYAVLLLASGSFSPFLYFQF
jgi:alginate O-acetyltransferase complex protein AlgI